MNTEIITKINETIEEIETAKSSINLPKRSMRQWTQEEKDRQDSHDRLVKAQRCLAAALVALTDADGTTDDVGA